MSERPIYGRENVESVNLVGENRETRPHDLVGENWICKLD